MLLSDWSSGHCEKQAVSLWLNHIAIEEGVLDDKFWEDNLKGDEIFD